MEDKWTEETESDTEFIIKAFLSAVALLIPGVMIAILMMAIGN